MKKTIIGFLLLLCILFGTIASAFAEDWIYTVRRGDTIWGLSHKYLKEPLKFKEIQSYNNVRFDKLIPPGTILKFPLEYLKFGPAEVSVIALKGQATFTRRGQNQPLTLQQKLTVDDQINTSSDSLVVLRFADGSELLLGENSELIFDVQTQYGETGMVDSRMRLNQGSAEGRVKKLIGPGAHFEVHTPSAVATVRGTEFRVRLDEDGNGAVFNEVSEGQVAVDLAQQNKLINQGFGIKTQAGQQLSEPKPLLPKPDLSQLLEVYPGHPVELRWPAIDGALNYHLELFNDSQMTQLEARYQTSQPVFKLPQIVAKNYWLRVRAVDSDGLQGLDSIHPFSISKVPQAPQLIAFDEAFAADQEIVFNWNASQDSDSYHWQLSDSESFTEILLEQQTDSTNRQSLDELEPGLYYWRVAAINQYGTGSFSSAERLEVVEPSDGKTAFSFGSILLFILLL